MKLVSLNTTSLYLLIFHFPITHDGPATHFDICWLQKVVPRWPCLGDRLSQIRAPETGFETNCLNFYGFGNYDSKDQINTMKINGGFNIKETFNNTTH